MSDTYEYPVEVVYALREVAKEARAVLDLWENAAIRGAGVGVDALDSLREALAREALARLDAQEVRR